MGIRKKSGILFVVGLVVFCTVITVLLLLNHESVVERAIQSVRVKQIRANQDLLWQVEQFIKDREEELIQFANALQGEEVLDAESFGTSFKKVISDENVFQNIIFYDQSASEISRIFNIDEPPRSELDPRGVLRELKDVYPQRVLRQRNEIYVAIHTKDNKFVGYLYSLLNIRHLTNKYFGPMFNKLEDKPEHSKYFVLFNSANSLKKDLGKLGFFKADEIEQMLSPLAKKILFHQRLNEKIIYTLSYSNYSLILSTDITDLIGAAEKRRNVSFTLPAGLFVVTLIFYYALIESWFKKYEAAIFAAEKGITGEEPTEIAYFGDRDIDRVLTLINRLKVTVKNLDTTDAHAVEIDNLKGELQKLKMVFAKIWKDREGFTEKFIDILKAATKSQSYYLKVILDKETAAEKQQLFLGYMEKDLEKMDYLIKSVLLLKKIEKLEQISTPETVDLKEVISRGENSVQEKLKEKKITLKTTLSDETVSVQGNRAALVMLVNLLLDNAIKFSDDEGEISLVARSDEEMVVIEVKDNGSGISQSVSEQIFQPFFKENEKSDGHGLGLTIAREIVQKHHGKISCQVQEEGGGLFIVEIPHT